MARKPPPEKLGVEALLAAAQRLARRVGHLAFGPPVALVYNPLNYAWRAHEAYLRSYGAPPKRIVFLGMNPGPFGMVQTGVPFGDVHAVRSWLGIDCNLGGPPRQHLRRPVAGFACTRGEVSGQRLWGLFAERFGAAREFFREHLVLNYCPLAFLEANGRNRTPDRLPTRERKKLFAVCDEHLRAAIAILRPEWVIGVGDFAFQRARRLFPNGAPRLGRILHPSPANPAANRDWLARVVAQLQQLGIWKA